MFMSPPAACPVHDSGRNIQPASALQCCSQPSALLVPAARSRYLSPPSSTLPCVPRDVFRKSELGASGVRRTHLLACVPDVSRSPRLPASAQAPPSALSPSKSGVPHSPLTPIQGPPPCSWLWGPVTRAVHRAACWGQSQHEQSLHRAPQPRWLRALQELLLSCPHTSSPLRSGQWPHPGS